MATNKLESPHIYVCMNGKGKHHLKLVVPHPICGEVHFRSDFPMDMSKPEADARAFYISRTLTNVNIDTLPTHEED